MAKLVIEEVVIPKAKLSGLDREIPADKETQRSLGLAAHYTLERLEFRDDQPGEVILRDILADIKAAVGVRAPRSPKDEDGPQPVKKKGKKAAAKKKASKKRASKKSTTKEDDTGDEGGESTPQGSNDDVTETGGQTEDADEDNQEGNGEDASFQEGGSDEGPEEPDSDADPEEPLPDESESAGPQLADPFASDD